MKDTFLAYLCSPDNGQPLTREATGERLATKSGDHEYEIAYGVPVLLPANATGMSAEAEQHRRLGTTFAYVAHYQRDAEVFDYFEPYEDAATRHENRRLHETIIAAVPKGTDHILDVGCGNAWVAGHFCPRGVIVCSMDISLVNTRRALEEFPFDNHFAVMADVYALPFPPRTFDCIIASEIIEHVPDPATFLTKLLAVLRPGGTLVVTTPYAEKIAYSLCIHCNRPTPHHAHLHSFTEEKLRNLLPPSSRAGVQVETFGNKALIKLQTHVLLRYLPYRLWRLKDRLANAVIRKPSRLMLRVKKGKRV